MPPRRKDFSSRPRSRTIVEVDAEDDDSSCGSYNDDHDDERFPLRKLPTPEELLQELSTNDEHENNRAVVGRWRDSLGWRDFVRHGYCHASTVTACCCAPCAAGQIATRLHLTPLTAQPITTTTVAKAAVFRTVVRWCVVYWLTRLVLLLLIAILDPNTFSDENENDSVNNNNNSSEQWIEPSAGYYFLCAVDDLLAWVYVLVCAVQLRNMRRTVRQKYQIAPPPSSKYYCCGPNAEDAACALFCPCLVAAQMLRHTADYDAERAAPFPCVSPTGLATPSSSIL